MSQYPSPYSPPPFSPYTPNYYASAPIDPLAAARRSSILMIVLGGLLIALSLCLAGMGKILSGHPLPPDLTTQVQQMEAQIGMTLSQLTLIAGIVVFVFAALMIVLGVMVRSGRMLPVIFSLILCSIALLFIIVVISAGLLGAINHQSPQSIVGACPWLVPAAMLALLLVWLISAARAAPHLAAMQAQQTAQYWQYQQNMQNYGGYGYAAPPKPNGSTPVDPNNAPPSS